MNKITDERKCTKCKACINICKKNAIEINEKDFIINKDKCIDCEMCYKVCPNNNNNFTFKTPIKTFAVWNGDDNIRLKSASGGVATTIQKYALENSIITYGVILDENFEAIFKEIKNDEDLKKTRNSKYVYSDIGKTYIDIEKNLKDKKNVIFIGMPCQVAGLLNYLKKDYINLITIDIVCHGMGPAIYFKEHINYLKDKFKINEINEIRFRKNNKYDFYIDSNDKELKIDGKYDLYQYAYHNGVIYNDACYSCNYARKERISDITICDFWGLENDKQLKEISKNGISAVIINTENGIELFNKIKDSINYIEREYKEIYNHNSTLNKPPQKHKKRDDFLNYYDKYGFEVAAKKTLFISMIIYNLKRNLLFEFLKSIISPEIKNKIKGILKRKNG